MAYVKPEMIKDNDFIEFIRKRYLEQPQMFGDQKQFQNTFNQLYNEGFNKNSGAGGMKIGNESVSGLYNAYTQLKPNMPVGQSSAKGSLAFSQSNPFTRFSKRNYSKVV
jgi:hypothetical protein